jgi:hypothetical protein
MDKARKETGQPPSEFMGNDLTDAGPSARDNEERQNHIRDRGAELRAAS